MFQMSEENMIGKRKKNEHYRKDQNGVSRVENTVLGKLRGKSQKINELTI